MSEPFTLPEGFTTEVLAHPGYDHRDDPEDGRGADGLHLAFVLRCPGNSAISWYLNTGWMRHPVRDLGWSIYLQRKPVRGTVPGIDLVGGQPSFADLFAGAVTIHHPKQLKDWWLPGGPCGFLGVECFNDSGYMVADRVLEALLDDGDAGVWRELHAIYQAWTAPDPDPDETGSTK